LVADQDDEAMALAPRGGERALDQRLPDAAFAKRRLDGERTEEERPRLADADRRQAHRADQQRADPRREREVEPVVDLLADAIGGARIAAGTESALVQPLDRLRVVRSFGQDGDRQIGHGRRGDYHLARARSIGQPFASRRMVHSLDENRRRKERFMAHGHFVDGVWHTGFHDTKSSGGRFKRGRTNFHNWVTPDGSAGPDGEGGFPAARGRYHLYVSLACPWAHRTVVFRKLKKLEDVIGMSVVEPVMGEHGWQFGPDADEDSVNGKKTLGEIYLLADPRYTGRSSVPLLWDKERRTIVNNESSEIIRMFNSAFDALTNERTDYYP